MRVLIPISYFRGNPTSEIWQIDIVSKVVSRLAKLKRSPIPVTGKGVTGLSWQVKGVLLACDFNSVFLLSRLDFSIMKRISSNFLNDLHAIHVTEKEVMVVNSGLDRIEIFNHDLKWLGCHSFLRTDGELERIVGDYGEGDQYYDSPNKPFNERKCPDTLHLNYSFRCNIDNKNYTLVTSFSKRCLMSLPDYRVISNTLPEQPHDGCVFDGQIWITTVSGNIYAAPLSFPLNFTKVLDLFSIAEHEGWCRGMCFRKSFMFIGITQIHEINSRTPWLRSPCCDTRTGVYQINLNDMSIAHFYDLTQTNGSRIFTLVEDNE